MHCEEEKKNKLLSHSLDILRFLCVQEYQFRIDHGFKSKIQIANGHCIACPLSDC